KCDRGPSSRCPAVHNEVRSRFWTLRGRHNLPCDLALTEPSHALTVIWHLSGRQGEIDAFGSAGSTAFLTVSYAKPRRDNGGCNGAQMVPSHTLHFGYVPRPRDPGGR